MVNPKETMFKELRLFKLTSKINPKETIIDLNIKFKKIFRVKLKAKNNEVKKEKIWKALAEVKVSGYGTFKITYAKIPQHISAGKDFKK